MKTLCSQPPQTKMRHVVVMCLVSALSVQAFLPSPLALQFMRRSETRKLRLGATSPILVTVMTSPMVTVTSKGEGESTGDDVKKSPSMAQTYMQGPISPGSHGPLSLEELTAAKEELKKIVEKGFREPVRSHMDDPDTTWRFGAAPDYALANLLFLKGKSKNHAEGSLEQIVEDLVKTWEMEASHKPDINQWQTITTDWKLGANGQKMYSKEESIAAGNYNETHEVMHDAFPAFPWEVLEVFSAPPKVMFSWRHWATFNGSYKGNKGNGELVEMYGLGVAEVSAELKLKTVEIYYKPEQFFEVLEGKRDPNDLSGGKSIVGSGCPFIH